MYPASSEGVNKETDDTVYFFTPAFYPLDNFSAHTVDIWNRRFATVEHAYQWKKFSETESVIAESIFMAPSPHVVKKIAEDNLNKVPQHWFDERISIMEQILTAKTKQHKDVQEILQKTGNRRIVENSPVDSFWGIGADGKGKNMVGQIWMTIRENGLR